MKFNTKVKAWLKAERQTAAPEPVAAAVVEAPKSERRQVRTEQVGAGQVGAGKHEAPKPQQNHRREDRPPRPPGENRGEGRGGDRPAR